MNYKQGMMIKIEKMECCVLDEQEINDATYIYVAEIEDEDITENFYVYKVIGQDKFEQIVNSDELKNILPVFIQSIEKSL